MWHRRCVWWKEQHHASLQAVPMIGTGCGWALQPAFRWAEEGVNVQVVIVDEAHRLKSTVAATRDAIHNCNKNFTLLLTGMIWISQNPTPCCAHAPSLDEHAILLKTMTVLVK